MMKPLPPYLDLTLDQQHALTELVFGPPSHPVSADVGFVFGGTHPGLWQTAVSMYQAGYVSRFVVTGGLNFSSAYHAGWTYGPDVPESHGIAEQMNRLGVPASAILTEDRSTNTLENVLFALEVADFTQFRSILAITKSYGTGRQLRTLRHHIPNTIAVHSVSFPTEGYNLGPGLIDRDNWTDTELRVRLVLGAYQRIMKYGLAGHLTPADPIPGVPYE